MIFARKLFGLRNFFITEGQEVAFREGEPGPLALIPNNQLTGMNKLRHGEMELFLDKAYYRED